MWKRSESTKDIELRKTFVDTLDELMSKNEKILLFEADLGGASGTTKLKDKFKDRFIQVGIAEANMIGIAAGISIKGYIPFIHTFSPFSTRRALDQIFISGAYSGNTINIYGSDSGFYAGANGGTHTTFDDISIMRNIPQTIVLAPADSTCFKWCLKEVAKLKGVHYIRGNRKANPKIYDDESEFELGKAILHRKGDDIVIYSMGGIFIHALEAADKLEQEGYSVSVVDMFSIKPFDRKLVVEESKNKKLAITFENHNIMGGLGSTISEVFTDELISTKLLRIGIKERFGQVGDPELQRKDYELTSERIVKDALKILRG